MLSSFKDQVLVRSFILFVLHVIGNLWVSLFRMFLSGKKRCSPNANAALVLWVRYNDVYF